MSIERCQQCGRYVDTDIDEGVYFTTLSDKYPDGYVFLCTFCSEKMAEKGEVTP